MSLIFITSAFSADARVFTSETELTAVAILAGDVIPEKAR